MKAKGFKKFGKYEYGATFDKALYRSGDRELEIIYTVHPCDYPYHGISAEEKINGRVVDKNFYSLESGTLAMILEVLAQEIMEGKVCHT